MDNPAPTRKVLVPLVAALAVVLVLWGLVAAIRSFVGSAPASKQKVAQEVRIIRPPPPPPEPEVKPPPPPPEEKVDIPEPVEAPEPSPSDEPPPGEQLGLDADGGAGGDGFGLVGRKGGRDLLSGSGGSAYAWYAGLLKNEILGELNALEAVRSGAYSVVVRVWVKPDGTIERFQLAQSSGDANRDRAIESALTRIARISQAPPADMPQPVSLRIVSRA